MPLENTNIPLGIGDYFMQWKDESGRLNLDVSTKVWELKESTPPISFNIKFSIIKLAQSYTKESKTCLLCQAEKVFIAYSDHVSTLNVR